MAYPSDSTIDSQPVADQSGQGSSYAAFYDQIYSNPSNGRTGDGASYATQSFAPDQTAAAVLPPYEDIPTEASAGQQPVNPWDTYVMDPAAAPGDAPAIPGEGTALAGDATGLAADGTAVPADAAAVPVDGVAVPGDGTAVPADGIAMQPEAQTAEEAVAQVEQHLRQKFDEVVQLGTTTPLNEETFCAAVTELVQTAELMGAFRALADGATAQPGDPAAEATPMEAMPADAMPADPTGGQLEMNPYEPQVPPVSSEAMAAPQEFATAGGEQLAQLQDLRNSQITQLMSFTAASPMNTSLPSGSPLEGGNVDNFKTALLNVVKTAEQIGAIAQTSQPAQSGESTQATNMG